ncbi:MAG: EAL domain-containing protein [Hyphomicrobiales bacterium]|nr:EAL domain-containing protein [Hyphomicrobiales bacterium]MCP4999902.1 EAL domain-containing protein [Hyphomicrobiales bacterium]
MDIESDSGLILREEDGSCSGSFGPFVLKTALQPIFGRNRSGQLRLLGFEGLLRLFLNDAPYSPAEFFARIGADRRLAVDALCRRIHLVNASLEPAEDVLLFLNFDPSLYEDNRQIASQINGLKTDVAASRFSPARIVCEMTEQQIAKPDRMRYLIDNLREAGFKIAVDDYGADSSDARRVELVQPDIVKLDAHWVVRLMESQSGFAILQDAVERFHQDGASVIMEGLEQGFQIDLAWGAGADLIQGFALARPQLAPTNISQLFGQAPA